ncbi:MAG: ribosomal protein L7/L12 [Gemmataceae bacterium]
MDPYWLLLFIPLAYYLLRTGSRAMDLRLRRVERKLDAIINHMGIVINSGVDPQLLELVREGKKIEAIKLYRESTGVGLKEAKDFVESL